MKKLKMSNVRKTKQDCAVKETKDKSVSYRRMKYHAYLC